MAKSATKRPHSKKKRRGMDTPKKKKGAIVGMRSGFKKVAKSVTGAEEPKSKSGAVINTIIVVVLIAAIAALLFYR